MLSPGSSIFVEVRKVDYAITVFDRRSGAEVGRGVVHASAPECPKGLSVKSNEKPALPSTHPVRFDLRKFFDGLRKK